VATASFWSPEIRESELAPIAISRGLPQEGRLPYRLAEHLRVLAPDRVEWLETFDEARAHYVARMGELGRMQLELLLRRIARDAGYSGVVLLCFEWKPDACHRSWFARWWEDTGGQTVAELAPPRPARQRRKADDGQVSLPGITATT
jgi:hypothetical protein